MRAPYPVVGWVSPSWLGANAPTFTYRHNCLKIPSAFLKSSESVSRSTLRACASVYAHAHDASCAHATWRESESPLAPARRWSALAARPWHGAPGVGRGMGRGKRGMPRGMGRGMGAVAWAVAGAGSRGAGAGRGTRAASASRVAGWRTLADVPGPPGRPVWGVGCRV